MKEITRKLLKHLVWMKPGKEKDAARRVTDAGQRNVKNGGKKNSVGVVLIPAAETGIATADVAPVPSCDNAPTDMSPAAIRLEGVAAAGSLEEAEVDDRGDNDLNNSSASGAEDDAAILSRDFQKLNIGFPVTCGEKPTIPRTAAASPTPLTRVPVACDSSSPDGEDVREGSKSSDSATKTACIADADKDDGKQQKDKDAAEQDQEEEGGEDDDDDEEEAREFNATMMRLSLTVRKKEVELDTFLERGPNGFSGSIVRDRGPYHGAYQSRGAMFEEGDVLTEGHALTQNIAHNCDAQITQLLIGLNVARLPILRGEEVETFLGRMAPENLERPEFSQAQDGASDGYPSPPSFGHDSDSIDSIDCGPSASPTSHFMEAGRIKELKDRVAKDLHGSQPSPDYMASMSPGSPWSTSTEGSSKSATPPQVYRSDPPAQPPFFPLSEKTPPNFVDQVDRPYHNWMRGQFMAKAKLEGYGWDKANKCPELITLLRDAERTRRADHQRIYECARGHMKYHIALLYEKDDNDKTALFYAARLYFDDHVAGFVAECLVEAQERCLKSNSGRRYRVDEELYGEEKDNVFHCLARWHRDENYVAMAATLLSIAPLVALLYRPNKAGRLPVDLCQHSDMRAMLDPRNRPYLMGAPL